MASVGTHKQPAKARKEEAKKAIRASIDTYNQSPRKVRLVTDLVKGKKAEEAIAELSFLSKRAAEPVKKLIQSAVANAKARGENVESLRVEDIRVDSAGMLVRFMPRAMGRAAPIRKRRSRIVVRLSADSK
ncbi:MAG TPA: 50S ribosomal protein L22 [Candidatus Paceibacterota bacterium]